MKKFLILSLLIISFFVVCLFWLFLVIRFDNVYIPFLSRLFMEAGIVKNYERGLGDGFYEATSDFPGYDKSRTEVYIKGEIEGFKKEGVKPKGIRLKVQSGKSQDILFFPAPLLVVDISNNQEVGQEFLEEGMKVRAYLIDYKGEITTRKIEIYEY